MLTAEASPGKVLAVSALESSAMEEPSAASPPTPSLRVDLARLRRTSKNPKIFHIPRLVCLVCFFLSLMFTHGAGNYIFQLFDSFAGNIPLLVIGLFECLGISYIYGIKKFATDVELMCGSRPSLYWLVCWKVVSPLLMVTILAASLIKMAVEGSTYLAGFGHGRECKLQWPSWAWASRHLVILPLMWIPLVPIANALGFRLLAEEEAAWFPEKELRSAQDITPQRFTALERALLCLSVSTESLKASMAFVRRRGPACEDPASQNSPASTRTGLQEVPEEPVRQVQQIVGRRRRRRGRTKPGDTPPHSSLKDGHLKGDGGKPLPRGRSEDRAAKRKDKVEKNNRNSM
ncbi:hypothetical protein C7M84_006341 [Penaeus vannamei]|uniref:Uncharacterized protein n=1 Tax=Penaeus vannamei TaxID=6689 RepID=A0A3R7P4F5_PENVA|nr:hypothetical protein C7M84_006341 [Penaeus vannamei]